MKKNLSIWSLVVCAGLVLSGMGLFAQTGTATRYSIPFEFLVGNTLMPAGEYTVKPLSLISPKHTRILQKTDGSKAVFVALGATQNNTETDSCKLIFSQMEEGYRLSRIHERNGVLALADSKVKSDKNETSGLKVAILKPAKIVVVKALLRNEIRQDNELPQFEARSVATSHSLASRHLVENLLTSQFSNSHQIFNHDFILPYTNLAYWVVAV